MHLTNPGGSQTLLPVRGGRREHAGRGQLGMAVEEIAQHPVERLRLIEIRRVPRAWDDLQPRSGDLLRHVFAGGEEGLVLVADEDASSGDMCEALLATLRFAVARVDSVDKAVSVISTLMPDVKSSKMAPGGRAGRPGS